MEEKREKVSDELVGAMAFAGYVFLVNEDENERVAQRLDAAAECATRLGHEKLAFLLFARAEGRRLGFDT